MAAAAAYADARALSDKVKARPQSASNDALLKQIDEIAPAAAAPAEDGGGRGGRGGRGGGRGGRAAAAAAPTDPSTAGFGAPPPPAAPTLANIGQQLVASVTPMQSSELPPTTAQVVAATKAQTDYTALMAKWTVLKAKVNPAPAAKK
jgi:hypothetical protein